MTASKRFIIEPEYSARGSRYHIIDTEEPMRTVVATHPTDRAAGRHEKRLTRKAARDKVYFIHQTRAGGWKVEIVREHSPRHVKRPASWRGPYPTKLAADAAIIQTTA
jgi:hypothetical protein